MQNQRYLAAAIERMKERGVYPHGLEDAVFHEAVLAAYRLSEEIAAEKAVQLELELEPEIVQWLYSYAHSCDITVNALVEKALTEAAGL